MNKYCYRIVFNKARGALMAVAETAVSRGKTSGTTSGHTVVPEAVQRGAVLATVRALTFGIWSALGLVMLPVTAYAQIVADPNAPANQRPTVLNTANGLPQVHIQTPSAAGVSRNTYSQFDVQSQGAILNNSRTNVQTQQGGWIQGNPWLATGAARVILNEVNSSNPSLLRGYVEVAGSRAQVVIANPAGVTCDGCGFLNANRATLTTGTPIVNGGNLEGYRVQGGAINITGAGLDASTVDYTDLIARSVQVNAGIWSKELKVTAGANQVDVAHTQATPIAGTGAASAFAIDVAQLGGMYAGKITLIGTEAGVGVRNAGHIGASAGEVIVTAEGRLENSGGLSSAGDTRIDTKSGVANTGTVYAQNDVQIAATGTFDNTGTIAAGRHASLSATGVGGRIAGGTSGVLGAGVNADGTLGVVGKLQLDATQDIQAAGLNLAAGELAMAAASIDLSGSQTSAQNVTLTASGGNLDATAATVAASQTLTVNAQQTLITDASVVSANQLALSANAWSNVLGQVTQIGTGDTTVNLQGNLDNTGGSIAVNSGNLTLGAATLTNAGGSIEHAGSGALQINATTLNGAQGSLVSNGQLVLTAQSATLDSGVTAASQITLDSASLSNRDGQIVQSGTGAAVIRATTELDNTGGTITSNGNLTLTTGDLVNKGGSVQAAGASTLAVNATGTVDNSAQGRLAAGGNLTLNANRPQNAQGQITTSQALQATVAQALDNTAGTLAAGQTVTVSAASIDNSGGTIGAVQGNASITASSGSFDNTGGRLEAGQNIALVSQGLDNTGGVVTAVNLDLDSGTQALGNTGGTIAATGTLDIRSGALTNDAGLIQASGAMAIDTNGQALQNINSGSSGGIVGQGGVALNAGAIGNQAGFIGARGDLNITGAQVNNTGGGILSSEQALTLGVTGLDNRGGQVQAVGNVTVQAGGGTVDNSASLIRSGATLSLSAGTVTNAGANAVDQGLQGQSVSIAANQINNSTGAILADNTLMLTGSGSINNSLGLISSGNSVAIADSNAGAGTARTQSIINTGGTVIATQTVSIDSAALSGDGKVLSEGDLSVKLTSNYTHTGELAANGTASLETTGRITNQAALAAGAVLNVKAGTIENQAGGSISAPSVNLTATAPNTLINRGLIDGQDTVIETVALNNLGTGRIFGDHVSIGATTVTNDVETVNGVTQAAVIAARDHLDIGAQTITNREHAMLFSAGDLAIGGSMDAGKMATGQAGTVNNNSATIEALGNVDISAARINNTNEHFSTTVQSMGTTSVVEYQGSGSPNRYLPGTPGVFIFNSESDHLATPEGVYEQWLSYNYTRSTTETVVQQSDPGSIVSGGAMNITAGTVQNDKSRIMAGGTLTGNIGTLTNTTVSGERIMDDVGTVTSFFRNRRKGRDTTGSSTAEYAPPTTIQSISLSPAVYQGNTAPTLSGTQITALATSSFSQSATGAGTASVSIGSASLVAPVIQVPATGSNGTGPAITIRTTAINTTVPNNALFGTPPDPTATYLIQTDPRFANYRTWLSSDYMLQQLSIDPAAMQKRLGDGFYEQKLIREQVARLTGRRFLDSYASDEAQYSGLIDNAITYASQWNLRPGIALTDAQMAALTSDIVWLVERDVTLANGQTTRALVPQLYVRVRDGDLDGSGALIAGNNVNLNLSGDLVNAGTIAGRNVMSLTAENVRNLGGRISGGDTTVSARTDLTNLGGIIEGADSLAAFAGRNLTVASTTRTQTNRQGSRTNIDRVAGLYVTNPGGTMTVAAVGDISLLAAHLINNAPTSAGVPAGSTTIVAGGNLTLGTVTESSNQSIAWDDKNFRKDSSRIEVGTTIAGNGDIHLSAGGDIKARAANVNSEQGALTAIAQGNISIDAGEAALGLDEAHQHKGKSGFLSKKTITTRDTLSETQALGGSFGGKSVALLAGNDLTIRGSSVVGDGGNVTLTAQTGQVLITAAQSSSTESHLYQEKKSGISKSAVGIGVTIGSSQQTSNFDAAGTSESDNRSVVGSTGGNLVITAGKDAAIRGSDLIADKATNDVLNATGHIDIQAQNIVIDPGQDTSRTTSKEESRQRGLTIALVGTPLDTARNLKDAKKRPTAFGRANAIATEIAASAMTAPQVAISYSKRASSSRTDTDDVTRSGSSLTAAGDIRLNATGSGAQDGAGRALDGDVTITGSNLTAGGEVRMDASRNITLQASTDQFRQTSDTSSRSTSFSLATPSPGDTLRHITGGPNNGRVGAFPYTKSTSSDNSRSEASVQTPTLVTATNVIINSDTGNVRIAGSGVTATTDIDITARSGKIDVVSGQDNRRHSEEHSAKTVGDLGSNATEGSTGTGFSIGVRKERRTLDTEQTQQSTIRSELTAGRDMTLDAGDDIAIAGTDLRTGRDLTLIGKNVQLDAGVDTVHTQQTRQVSQAGSSLTMSGYIVEAAKALEQAANAHEKDDKRLAVLYGTKAALIVATNGINPVNPAGGSAAIKATASIGSSSSSSKSENSAAQHTGSTLAAGETATIIATGSGVLDAAGKAVDGDITARGTRISGNDVVLAAARDINLQSAVDEVTMSSEERSRNASIGIGFGLGGQQNGFTLEIAAARAKSDANGESTMHQNTQVTAERSVMLDSRRDVNLLGAQVRGEGVAATVGRDLNIVSQQDMDVYHSKEDSSGFAMSLCIPPFCIGNTVSAGVNQAKGNTDSVFQSVREQSGIYAGQDGFDVTVGGNTDLQGGVIASTAAAGRNRLVTGTLTTSDLDNKAEYKSSSSSLSLSYTGGTSSLAGGVTPTDNLLQNVGGNLAANVAGNAIKPQEGAARGTTRSAISAADIVITDDAGQETKTGKSAADTVASLNRDTDSANGAIDKIFDLEAIKKEQEYRKALLEVAQQAAPFIYKQIGDLAKSKTETYDKAQLQKLAAQGLLENETDPARRAALEQSIAQANQTMAANQSEYDLWKEGGAYKIALHGLAGAGLAKFAGGDALTGALAGAANEAKTSLLNELTKGLNQDEQKFVNELASLATGAAIGDTQTAVFTLLADKYNRQLHEAELQKLARLTGEFKRRLKEQGIEVSDEVAFGRLLAQAAKNADSVNFKDRDNDPIAQAFLTMNSGTFMVDGKLYKEFQAQSPDEKNNHDLFKDALAKYRPLYTSAGQTVPLNEALVPDGLEVSYWKTKLTTRERFDASMALGKGDAKALAEMAKSTGSLVLDTLILGDTNAVGTPIYEEARTRTNGRLSAAWQFATHPVVGTTKIYDGIGQQLTEIESLRAQGTLDEANQKLGELGTQLLVASKGATGTTLAVTELTGKFVAKLDNGSTKNATVTPIEDKFLAEANFTAKPSEINETTPVKNDFKNGTTLEEHLATGGPSKNSVYGAHSETGFQAELRAIGGQEVRGGRVEIAPGIHEVSYVNANGKVLKKTVYDSRYSDAQILSMSQRASSKVWSDIQQAKIGGQSQVNVKIDGVPFLVSIQRNSNGVVTSIYSHPGKL